MIPLFYGIPLSKEWGSRPKLQPPCLPLLCGPTPLTAAHATCVPWNCHTERSTTRPSKIPARRLLLASPLEPMQSPRSLKEILYSLAIAASLHRLQGQVVHIHTFPAQHSEALPGHIIYLKKLFCRDHEPNTIKHETLSDRPPRLHKIAILPPNKHFSHYQSRHD